MNKKMDTKTMVLGAVLTALVVVLQFMGAFIKFGIFSISLVLLPIVIGAATCGVKMGAWLGLIFGGVVLASGDAAPFFAIDAAGTVITVLAKGILCGLCAGLVYRALEKYSRLLAVVVAAAVCPLVNTGVFLIGCKLFFMPTSTIGALVVSLVGINFLIEIGTNLVLSPVVVRLLQIRENSSKN